MAGLVELRIQEAVEVELGVTGMELGGQFTDSPAPGVIVEPRLTEPAKLNVLVIETVIDVPEAPVLKLPELAEIMKSPT